MTDLDQLFPPPSARQIVLDVCKQQDVTLNQIFGRRRVQRLAHARALAQSRLHHEAGLNKITLARLFRCNHTSVLHNIRKIDAISKEGK